MPPPSNPFEENDVSTALQKPRGQAPPSGGFELRVMAGPDRDAALIVDAATPDRAIVGQSPASSLRLTDREVSRRHFGVEMAGPYLKVTDLGSTNGTLINGLRIVDAELSGGEQIHIGKTVLRVERRDAHQPSPIPTDARFGRIVGASQAMRKLQPVLYRLADAEVPIIIEGETGTGKELLAETLHEFGPRKTGPFVVVDCAGLPAPSLEAALFGEEGGEAGGLEQANGGTVLIDEVGDLDLQLQGKLLRAIDRKEVWRVGGTRPVTVDVRLIATTRHDLDAQVQGGRFRDDLYFRLAVARIELPPLRKREGDVALLAAHFWSALAGTGSPPPDLLARFANYKWPGNVRELRNVVARQISLSPGDHEVVVSVPGASASPGGVSPATTSGSPTVGADGTAAPADVIEVVLGEDLPLPRAREKVVDVFERRYVERVLKQHGGNVARAAAASGLALRYFQKIRARQR